MDLLPEELRKTLPPLYSQESSRAPFVHAKFFTPDAGWTWLITEGSEEGDGDWLLFGYVIGLEEECWVFPALRNCERPRSVLPARGT
jgi:hypothetical protein